MRKAIVLFVVSCWAVGASAQSARTLTLKECVELALGNSAQLKKARLDRQGVDLKLREARSAIFPQISAGLNLDYYPVLPTTFLPGEPLGSSSEYIAMQFNQPWQAGAVARLDQAIYSESGRRLAKTADVSRALYDLLTERTEDDVVYNTATVFYQSMQTEQLLRTANANIDKLSTLQRMAELQLANDYAIPIDVKRVQVARANLETQRANLVNTIRYLHQTLQFLCGLPFDAPIEPVSEISSPSADSIRFAGYTLDVTQSVEHRLLEKNIALHRLRKSSLNAEMLPDISAYAMAGTQAQRTDAMLYDNKQRWYSVAAVGLKINAPIYNGFRQNRGSDLLEVEALKLEADREALFQGKELEYRQALSQLEGARQLLKNQEANVALAREISDKLMLQYREGVVSLTDLLTAQTALSEAETNYWQQVYGYKLAVLKFLKASGRLEELR